MTNASQLLREGRLDDLWQLCCGFLDLSISEVMGIQRRLLMEQIELLKRCDLGNRIMRGASPRSIAEFRAQVPLTTYADYAPILLEKREDALPGKPIVWQRTSGRSCEYPCKWAPMTQTMYDEILTTFMAVLIIASCNGRGDVRLRPHQKMLYGMAPPPYASGVIARLAAPDLPVDFIPSVDEAEKLSFEERIQRGFQIATSEGLDIFYGIPGVLVAVADQFGKRSSLKDLRGLLGQPKVFLRLARAVAKSKLARRPLMPRDVWPVRGVISAGTDNSIYREKIRRLWGRYPLDLYGSSEMNIVAMQTWDYQGMTFIPHSCFLEFIPEADHFRLRLDPTYPARTLTLDEVRAGEKYEIVATSFHGGPFVRYRIGDMIEITAARNEELNIDIPQMTFDRRADGLIDLAGFAGLTERTIWQAIEGSGVKYQDWTARKESAPQTLVHLYLELKDGADENATEALVTRAIDQQLTQLDDDYANLKNMLDMEPLKVTLLPKGSFREYIARQRAAGADLAHLKPPHVNPSDGVMHAILAGSTIMTSGATSSEMPSAEVTSTKVA